MTTCAREGCSEEFEKTAHNMKYHDAGCRKIASDEKILNRYYRIKDDKQRKGGKCKKCKANLSIYNKTDMCSPCQYRVDNEDLMNTLRDMQQ